MYAYIIRHSINAYCQGLEYILYHYNNIDEKMTQIACHECDLLLNLPAITEGQRANCPRCNHLLCVNLQGGMERSLAKHH
jgi:uncharacterized paraquat-inducible protein A